jgi:hypothetical protein
MTPISSHPWIRCAIAALAGLLVMGWCAPSRLLASCGDYVTSGHGRSAPHEMSPLPVFDVNTPLLDREGLPQMLNTAFAVRNLARPGPCQQCPMAPSDTPCQGPWCSGSHVPMPVLPSTIEHVQDHWACWGSAEANDPGEQVGLHVFQDQQDRIHHVFPIFHPPRPI